MQLKTDLSEPAARLTSGFRGRWAPNGNAIAFLRGTTNSSDLWRIGLDGNAEQRLTSGIVPAAVTRRPYDVAYAEYRWSPDSAQLVYSSRKSGQSNLWQVAADGTQDVRLTDNADNQTTLYSPYWSLSGEKLIYISNTASSTPQRPSTQRLHLWESGKSSVLLEQERALRILGWITNGQELLVAASPFQGPVLDKEIELFRLSINNGQTHTVGNVSNAYSYSFALAEDGQKLALSARRNGRDNIELFSVNNSESRQLTNNLDPAVLYSSLRWSTSGRQLFYSKQEMWQEVLLITKKSSE